jgi:hypothetical protein
MTEATAEYAKLSLTECRKTAYLTETFTFVTVLFVSTRV